jgi:hypothetical protein
MSNPSGYPSQRSDSQLLALQSQLPTDKDCRKDKVHQRPGDLGSRVGGTVQALEFDVVTEPLFKRIHQYRCSRVLLVMNGQTEADQLFAVSEPRNYRVAWILGTDDLFEQTRGGFDST